MLVAGAAWEEQIQSITNGDLFQAQARQQTRQGILVKCFRDDLRGPNLGPLLLTNPGSKGGGKCALVLSIPESTRNSYGAHIAYGNPKI